MLVYVQIVGPLAMEIQTIENLLKNISPSKPVRKFLPAKITG